MIYRTPKPYAVVYITLVISISRTARRYASIYIRREEHTERGIFEKVDLLERFLTVIRKAARHYYD